MKAKEFNVGIALLKLWMCYEVVMVHAWNVWSYPNGAVPFGLGWIKEMRAYAVPVFMLITFYLAAANFRANDGGWLKRRFARLVTPHVFWSVLAFVTWGALASAFPTFGMDASNGAFWTSACKTPSTPITFEYLGLQLVFGTTRTLGSQMWFQSVLLILTGLFAVFFRLVKPRYVMWGLAVVFFGAAMVEHSGLNRWLFEGFRYEICNPAGRIVPMLPYAALGLFLGAYKSVFAALETGKRWALVAFGAAIAVFLVHFEVFVSPPGFYYKGFKMLFIALGLVMAFGFLPTGKLPERVRTAIVWASRYSMGVYFVHVYLGKLLEELVFPHVGLVPRSFAGGCAVFAVSFAVCWLVSLVPFRRVRELVS